MIRHAFMLVWNRKRANALIMLELIVTFLILFALAGFSLHLCQLYRTPLGFNVADTWSVTTTKGGAWAADDTERFRQVFDIVRQMNEVSTAELMFDLPFDFGGNSMSVDIDGVLMPEVDVNIVTDALPAALGVQLLQGRWFGPEDAAQQAADARVVPVLVNRAFVELAGGEALGKVFSNGPQMEHRVVGVFDDFRQHGQFAVIRPMMFQWLRPDVDYFEAPRIVLILKPGRSADFEERLLGALQRAAPGWDFDVDAWEVLEATHFRLYTIPLMVAGGVVLFLLAIVGFGMLGVLWQDVIRRTPEMGLRRAMGATADVVRLQVVLELLAVAVLALVIGVALVVQVPLAGIIRALDWNLFVQSAVVSTVLLLALCMLFVLYPSYQATRQDPIDALRYE